eukprot:963161-Prorocentrum_minimum.AAC.3
MSLVRLSSCTLVIFNSFCLFTPVTWAQVEELELLNKEREAKAECDTTSGRKPRPETARLPGMKNKALAWEDLQKVWIVGEVFMPELPASLQTAPKTKRSWLPSIQTATEFILRQWNRDRRKKSALENGLPALTKNAFSRNNVLAPLSPEKAPPSGVLSPLKPARGNLPPLQRAGTGGLKLPALK